jgi:hypothetical protein
LVDDYWIKALGGGPGGTPLPNNWRNISFLTHAATFGTKCGMRAGDGIVYYATGTGLFFAVGEVTSDPYLAEDPSQTNWPWRVNVTLDHSTRLVDEGVPLETLSVDGRNLRVSMRRRSHIRLSENEYDAAVRALAS